MTHFSYSHFYTCGIIYDTYNILTPVTHGGTQRQWDDNCFESLYKLKLWLSIKILALLPPRC